MRRRSQTRGAVFTRGSRRGKPERARARPGGRTVSDDDSLSGCRGSGLQGEKPEEEDAQHRVPRAEGREDTAAERRQRPFQEPPCREQEAQAGGREPGGPAVKCRDGAGGKDRGGGRRKRRGEPRGKVVDPEDRPGEGDAPPRERPPSRPASPPCTQESTERPPLFPVRSLSAPRFGNDSGAQTLHRPWAHLPRTIRSRNRAGPSVDFTRTLRSE
jgi:hypothetical protein